MDLYRCVLCNINGWTGYETGRGGKKLKKKAAPSLRQRRSSVGLESDQARYVAHFVHRDPEMTQRGAHF